MDETQKVVEIVKTVKIEIGKFGLIWIDGEMVQLGKARELRELLTAKLPMLFPVRKRRAKVVKPTLEKKK